MGQINTYELVKIDPEQVERCIDNFRSEQVLITLMMQSVNRENKDAIAELFTVLLDDESTYTSIETHIEKIAVN